MKLSVKVGKVEKEKAEAIVLFFFEEFNKDSKVYEKLNSALKGMLADLVRSAEFTGKIDQSTLLHTSQFINAKRLLLVGLGKKKDLHIDIIRRKTGNALKRLRDARINKAVVALPEKIPNNINAEEFCQSIAEGSELALFKFDKLARKENEGKKEIKELVLLLNDRKTLAKTAKGIETGRKISAAVNMSRELIIKPANYTTPTFLAEKAKEISGRLGLKCRVLGEKEIRKLKMGAFLSVAKGSHEPPKFIILDYHPKNSGNKTVALVGKGITFDSGGISLKPSQNLHKMKYDMAGGAVVLGVIQAAASLKLPLRIVGLIPATENLPGGSATKPGDVVVSLSGKSIEIQNTDAEGRLILADALYYAKRFSPDAIIDLATLTGACFVALGDQAIGMMGNNKDLMDMFRKAGEKTFERVWELPLWKEYEEQIKSDIADVKNIGSDGGAGAILGGIFLRKFVNNYPWIHLDIAGTAWTDKDRDYNPRGATGVGVRLITEVLRRWK